MKIDLTLPISTDHWHDLLQQLIATAQWEKLGHLGTHFDVMEREFPLEYCELPGTFFDVSQVRGRDIELADIEQCAIREGDFVIIHTGWLREQPYGTPAYLHAPVVLSMALIHSFIERHVSLIGVDLPGIRPAAEHRAIDSYCAQHGAFVIENLYHLESLARESAGQDMIISTYPMRIQGATGLPCRVVATLRASSAR